MCYYVIFSRTALVNNLLPTIRSNVTTCSLYLHQSVLRKVAPEDAPQISDPIMTALLQMLQTSCGKSGGVQEDALLAVSTLVEGG